MSKKCPPLWHEAHFQVKTLKTLHVRTTFGRGSVVLCGRRKGFCFLPKVSKTWGFGSISKTMAGMGHLKRICKDGFWVAGAVQETCPSEMFTKGCILEHQIFRFAKMILRDRRGTSYDLASLFRGRRGTLNRWKGKIVRRIGTRPSALPSTFHFWRNSRRIVSFLMLSSSKNEEVSQNSFDFDIVKFKHWGSLAELLRFDVVKFKNWGSLAE